LHYSSNLPAKMQESMSMEMEQKETYTTILWKFNTIYIYLRRYEENLSLVFTYIYFDKLFVILALSKLILESTYVRCCQC